MKLNKKKFFFLILLGFSQVNVVAEETIQSTENEVHVSTEILTDESQVIDMESKNIQSFGKGAVPSSKFPKFKFKDNAVVINAKNGDFLSTHMPYEDKIGYNSEYGFSSGSRIFDFNFDESSIRYWFEFLPPENSSITNINGYDGEYTGEIKDGFDTVKVKIREENVTGNIVKEDTIIVRTFTETPYFKKINDNYAIKVSSKSKGELPYLTSSEILRKNKNEVDSFLESDLNFDVYELKSGEKINKKPTFVRSSFANSGNLDDERGSKNITIKLDNIIYDIPGSLLVISDKIEKEFGDLNSEWRPVNFREDTTIVNPINDSKISLINRGQLGYRNASIGYTLRDKNDRVPTWDPSATDHPLQQIPVSIGIDSKQIYLEPIFGDEQWLYEGASFRLSPLNDRVDQARIQNPNIYHLKHKSKNQFLQIFVDNDKKVTYTYSVELARNLSYKIDLKMYNNDAFKMHNFYISETIDVMYGTIFGADRARLPVYSLGNHKGFSIEGPDPGNPYSQVRYSTKFKNDNLDPISDYKKYIVSDNWYLRDKPFGSNGKNLGLEAQEPVGVGQRFNPDLSDRGSEVVAYSTDWKLIRFDDYLHAGTEQFIGEEIPYMTFNVTPEEKNIYEDEWFSDPLNYKLEFDADEHQQVKEGKIEFSYPNGKIEYQDFNRRNNVSKITGKHDIVRNNFPDRLNDDEGTMKKYPVEGIAVNKSPGGMYDLPSNESYFNLNVYNLGATPILQTIPQFGEFSKKPKDIVTNPTILPEHKNSLEIVYFYEGKEIPEINKASDVGIDTKKLGTSYIQVKVKDKFDSKNIRSTIVDVPIHVYEGDLPTGLFLDANDFTIVENELENLSDRDIDDLVLKKSRALGIDMTTKTSEGVKLSIDPSKRLPYDAKAGENKVVRIIASKDGFANKTKDINVKVVSKLEATAVSQKINIGEQDIDYKKFVKNVKASGKDLSPDEYEVKLSSDYVIPDVITQTKNQEIAKVDVILISDGTTIQKDVPIEVMWGNSISFGGNQANNRMGGGTYALHNSKVNPDRAYIKATSGSVNSDDNDMVSADFAKEYFQLGTYSFNGDLSDYAIVKGEYPKGMIKPLGTDLKQDVLNSWGEDRIQEVHQGDIVRGFSLEPEKQYLTQINSDKPLPLNNTDHEIYYEVTKDGYRRLQFNRIDMGAVGANVHYGISEEELDKKAKNGEFIKLNALEAGETRNAEIVGFKSDSYPDVSKPGKSDGTILIKEKLLSSKTIYYEVTLSFNILDGGFRFESAQPLSFGKHKLPKGDTYFTPEDSKNSVVVIDTRYKKEKWNLQARMEDSLHYNNGKSNIELFGSNVTLFDNQLGDQVLSKEAKTVRKIGDSQPLVERNEIIWDNKTNQGYRLFVKGGSAEKDKEYQSDITYSIEDAPKAKAAGK